MINKLNRILASFLCFTLLLEQSTFAQVIGQLDVSAKFASLSSSFTQEKFRPLHLRSLAIDSRANNFNLLLDRGDTKQPNYESVQDAAKTLFNYFLIGISLPNESFWVNLRPDSPDSIIDPLVAQTDAGKVLLEADVQLKRDTAKATSPQTAEGKKYWQLLYKKAEELFGYENVTIPTLVRPWIVPDEIIVRESPTNAYVYKATLKVMLEQDYLKGSNTYNFKDPRQKALNEYAAQLTRELIIPILNREVNSAKRYAPLRQLYYSLIIAQWFKSRFRGKGSSYSGLIDQKSLFGLTSKSAWSTEAYFQEYRDSFSKGEYNIKETISTPFGQNIRTYFSGGLNLSSLGSPINPTYENPAKLHTDLGAGGKYTSIVTPSAKEMAGPFNSNISLSTDGLGLKINTASTTGEAQIEKTPASSPVLDYQEQLTFIKNLVDEGADSFLDNMEEKKKEMVKIGKTYGYNDRQIAREHDRAILYEYATGLRKLLELNPQMSETPNNTAGMYIEMHNLSHELYHFINGLKLMEVVYINVPEIRDMAKVINEYKTEYDGIKNLAKWSGIAYADTKTISAFYEDIKLFMRKGIAILEAIKTLLSKYNETPDEDLLAIIDKVQSINEKNVKTLNRLQKDLVNPQSLIEPTNIGNSIETIINDVINKEKSHDINFVLNLRDADFRVQANPFRLEYLWINLARNSVYAIQKLRKSLKEHNADGKLKGLITVSTKVVNIDGQDFVEVSFSDNGSGIENEYLKDRWIFGKDNTTKEDGTGLGLWLCSDIAKTHGGSIDAFSEGLGKGARFVVRLPVSSSPVSPGIESQSGFVSGIQRLSDMGLGGEEADALAKSMLGYLKSNPSNANLQNIIDALKEGELIDFRYYKHLLANIIRYSIAEIPEFVPTSEQLTEISGIIMSTSLDEIRSPLIIAIAETIKKKPSAAEQFIKLYLSLRKEGNLTDARRFARSVLYAAADNPNIAASLREAAVETKDEALERALNQSSSPITGSLGSLRRAVLVTAFMLMPVFGQHLSAQMTKASVGSEWVGTETINRLSEKKDISGLKWVINNSDIDLDYRKEAMEALQSLVPRISQSREIDAALDAIFAAFENPETEKFINNLTVSILESIPQKYGMNWERNTPMPQDIYYKAIAMLRQIGWQRPELVRPGSFIEFALSLSDYSLLNKPWMHYKTYLSPALEEKMKEFNVNSREKYSIALAAYYLLRSAGAEASEATIAKASDFIIKQRQEFGKRIIFGKNVTVLSINDAESSRGDARLLEKLAVESGVSGENIYDFVGGKDMERALDSIANTAGPLTINFSMHGTAWAVQMDSTGTRLFYQDLAQALAKRKDLKDVTIIFNQCFSYDFTEKLLRELYPDDAKEEAKGLPTIIATSDYGHPGISTADRFTKSEDTYSVFLLQLDRRSRVLGTPLTGKDVLNTEAAGFEYGGMFQSENPSTFIFLTPQDKEELKEIFNQNEWRTPALDIGQAEPTETEGGILPGRIPMVPLEASGSLWLLFGMAGAAGKSGTAYVMPLDKAESASSPITWAKKAILTATFIAASIFGNQLYSQQADQAKQVSGIEITVPDNPEADLKKSAEFNLDSASGKSQEAAPASTEAKIPLHERRDYLIEKISTPELKAAHKALKEAEYPKSYTRYKAYEDFEARLYDFIKENYILRNIDDRDVHVIPIEGFKEAIGVQSLAYDGFSRSSRGEYNLVVFVDSAFQEDSSIISKALREMLEKKREFKRSNRRFYVKFTGGMLGGIAAIVFAWLSINYISDRFPYLRSRLGFRNAQFKNVEVDGSDIIFTTNAQSISVDLSSGYLRVRHISSGKEETFYREESEKLLAILSASLARQNLSNHKQEKLAELIKEIPEKQRTVLLTPLILILSQKDNVDSLTLEDLVIELLLDAKRYTSSGNRYLDALDLIKKSQKAEFYSKVERGLDSAYQDYANNILVLLPLLQQAVGSRRYSDPHNSSAMSTLANLFIQATTDLMQGNYKLAPQELKVILSLALDKDLNPKINEAHLVAILLWLAQEDSEIKMELTPLIIMNPKWNAKYEYGFGYVVNELIDGVSRSVFLLTEEEASKLKAKNIPGLNQVIDSVRSNDRLNRLFNNENRLTSEEDDVSSEKEIRNGLAKMAVYYLKNEQLRRFAMASTDNIEADVITKELLMDILEGLESFDRSTAKSITQVLKNLFTSAGDELLTESLVLINNNSTAKELSCRLLARNRILLLDKLSIFLRYLNPGLFTYSDSNDPDKFSQQLSTYTEEIKNIMEYCELNETFVIGLFNGVFNETIRSSGGDIIKFAEKLISDPSIGTGLKEEWIKSLEGFSNMGQESLSNLIGAIFKNIRGGSKDAQDLRGALRNKLTRLPNSGEIEALVRVMLRGDLDNAGYIFIIKELLLRAKTEKEKARYCELFVQKHSQLNMLSVLNPAGRRKLIASDLEFSELVNKLVDRNEILEKLSDEGLSNLNELLQDRYTRWPKGAATYISSVFELISPAKDEGKPSPAAIDFNARELEKLKRYNQKMSHLSRSIYERFKKLPVKNDRDLEFLESTQASANGMLEGQSFEEVKNKLQAQDAGVDDEFVFDLLMNVSPKFRANVSDEALMGNLKYGISHENEWRKHVEKFIATIDKEKLAGYPGVEIKNGKRLLFTHDIAIIQQGLKDAERLDHSDSRALLDKLSVKPAQAKEGSLAGILMPLPQETAEDYAQRIKEDYCHWLGQSGYVVERVKQINEALGQEQDIIAMSMLETLLEDGFKDVLREYIDTSRQAGGEQAKKFNKDFNELLGKLSVFLGVPEDRSSYRDGDIGFEFIKAKNRIIGRASKGQAKDLKQLGAEVKESAAADIYAAFSNMLTRFAIGLTKEDSAARWGNIIKDLREKDSETADIMEDIINSIGESQLPLVEKPVIDQTNTANEKIIQIVQDLSSTELQKYIAANALASSQEKARTRWERIAAALNDNYAQLAQTIRDIINPANRQLELPVIKSQQDEIFGRLHNLLFAEASYELSKNHEKLVDRFVGTEQFEMEVIKSVWQSVYGATADICIYNDVRLLDKDTFLLLALKSEGQFAGYVNMHIINRADGKKVLLLAGINPSDQYLAKHNSREIFEIIINDANMLADISGADILAISSAGAAISNRSSIADLIRKQNYDKDKLGFDHPVGGSYVSNEYYVVWEKEARPVSQEALDAIARNLPQDLKELIDINELYKADRTAAGDISRHLIGNQENTDYLARVFKQVEEAVGGEKAKKITAYMASVIFKYGRPLSRVKIDLKDEYAGSLEVIHPGGIDIEPLKQGEREILLVAQASSPLADKINALRFKIAFTFSFGNGPIAGYKQDIDQAMEEGRISFISHRKDAFSVFDGLDAAHNTNARRLDERAGRVFASLAKFLEGEPQVLELGPGAGGAIVDILNISDKAMIDTVSLTPIASRIILKASTNDLKKWIAEYTQNNPAGRLTDIRSYSRQGKISLGLAFDLQQAGYPVFDVRTGQDSQPFIRHQYIGSFLSKDMRLPQYDFITDNMGAFFYSASTQDYHAALDKIYGLLKPGGIFYCADRSFNKEQLEKLIIPEGFLVLADQYNGASLMVIRKGSEYARQIESYLKESKTEQFSNGVYGVNDFSRIAWGSISSRTALNTTSVSVPAAALMVSSPVKHEAMHADSQSQGLEKLGYLVTEKLKFQKQVVVGIYGYPAVGKTTFSKEFANSRPAGLSDNQVDSYAEYGDQGLRPLERKDDTRLIIVEGFYAPQWFQYYKMEPDIRVLIKRSDDQARAAFRERSLREFKPSYETGAFRLTEEDINFYYDSNVRIIEEQLSDPGISWDLIIDNDRVSSPVGIEDFINVGLDRSDDFVAGLEKIKGRAFNEFERERINSFVSALNDLQELQDNLRKSKLGYPQICYQATRGASKILSAHGFRHSMFSNVNPVLRTEMPLANFIKLNLAGVEVILDLANEAYTGKDSGITVVPTKMADEATEGDPVHEYTYAYKWPSMVEAKVDIYGHIKECVLRTFQESPKDVVKVTDPYDVQWAAVNKDKSELYSYIQLGPYEGNDRFVETIMVGTKLGESAGTVKLVPVLIEDDSLSAITFAMTQGGRVTGERSSLIIDAAAQKIKVRLGEQESAWISKDRFFKSSLRGAGDVNGASSPLEDAEDEDLSMVELVTFEARSKLISQLEGIVAASQKPADDEVSAIIKQARGIMDVWQGDEAACEKLRNVLNGIKIKDSTNKETINLIVADLLDYMRYTLARGPHTDTYPAYEEYKKNKAVSSPIDALKIRQDLARKAEDVIVDTLTTPAGGGRRQHRTVWSGQKLKWSDGSFSTTDGFLAFKVFGITAREQPALKYLISEKKFSSSDQLYWIVERLMGDPAKAVSAINEYIQKASYLDSRSSFYGQKTTRTGRVKMLEILKLTLESLIPSAELKLANKILRHIEEAGPDTRGQVSYMILPSEASYINKAIELAGIRAQAAGSNLLIQVEPMPGDPYAEPDYDADEEISSPLEGIYPARLTPEQARELGNRINSTAMPDTTIVDPEYLYEIASEHKGLILVELSPAQVRNIQTFTNPPVDRLERVRLAFADSINLPPIILKPIAKDGKMYTADGHTRSTVAKELGEGLLAYLPADQKEEILKILNAGGSSPVKSDKGGIDFRALPITAQTMGTVLKPITDLNLENRPHLNLDREWKAIEGMLKAGIIPSSERIKEYAQASCFSRDCDKEIAKVLSCVASIMRMEEERCISTEAALTDLLMILESDRSASKIHASLAAINVLPQEPKDIKF